MNSQLQIPPIRIGIFPDLLFSFLFPKNSQSRWGVDQEKPEQVSLGYSQSIHPLGVPPYSDFMKAK